MPIVVEYGADPTLQAIAAARGSGAAVAAEQEWRDRQLAEQQYQFDQNEDWRMQQAALQDRLARYEMGNRTALGIAGLQQNAANNQLDYMLGQQQLAQRDEQLGVQAAVELQNQQQITDRTQLSQLGQIARQQQQQRFEAAMADRKAAEQWMRTASPRQLAQFRQNWEQTYQMPWTAPEDAMAAQEDQEVQARRQQWLGMLQAPDGSGELIVPENVADMLMNMEPEAAMGSYTKMLDTWTRRKKDEQDAAGAQMKAQESAENIRRDDERADQQLSNTQAAHEQKMKQTEMIHQQKMQQSARNAYNKAKADWLKLKNDPLATSVGDEPKPEDYGVTDGESQSGSQDKIVTNKLGKRAILHPDGSVTPID